MDIIDADEIDAAAVKQTNELPGSARDIKSTEFKVKQRKRSNLNDSQASFYYFRDDPDLAKLEVEAIQNGFQYVDEVVLKDNVVYKGYMQDGLRHGPGIQKWPNGDRYEGGFENDKTNGQGLYISAEGFTSEGYWKNDLKDGVGTETNADGSTYAGGYKEGMKHGKGKFTWLNESTYDGDWIEDKMEGFGVFT